MYYRRGESLLKSNSQIFFFEILSEMYRICAVVISGSRLGLCILTSSAQRENETLLKKKGS